MGELQERAAAIRQRWGEGGENPSSSLDENTALEMGILQPEKQIDNEPQVSDNKNTPPQDERQYEKLGFWQSQGDMLRAVGTEAVHFFQPKALESDYQARTHYAENMKYLYRYGVGTAAFLTSFLWGGGEVVTAGAIVKGVAMANNAAKAAKVGGDMIKLGQGIQKLVNAGKVVNTTKMGLQAARAGKSAKAAIVMGNTINASVDGLVAGALADFTLYRQDEGEGHLADNFGDTDNPLISFLQTKEDDTEFEARLKNVVDGLIIGLPFGAAIGGGVAAIALKPTVRKLAKGIHNSLHAQTAEEASEALINTAQAKISMDNIAKTLDMVDEIDKLRAEAAETGQEVSQLIIDNFPANKIEEAKEIARLRDAGEEIFPYEDGHWSVKVTKYEDAYKVSPEEYKYQLNYEDPDGNLAISHMNSAVEATWKQRGLVDGEGLLAKSEKERNNTTKAVVDYYKDKWELGKNKITVKYGDWSDIPDGKTTQYKNGNVFIQINKNSKDIYASLRSELEHARDFLKGERPAKAEVKGSGEHFARYKGDNEADIAPDYVYKKSQGRAKAVELEQYKPIDKKELDNYKVNSYKDTDFGTPDPDMMEEGYEHYTVHNITNQEGQNLAHLRIKDGNYIDWRVNNKVEKGAARKLIAKLLYDGKYQTLVWDATTEESVKSYERFCREFPDLVDRIQYTDRTRKHIDSQAVSPYNKGEGVSLNDKTDNQLSEQQPILEEGRGNRQDDTIQTGTSTQEGQEALRDRSISSGNSTADARGENTLNNSRGEQLKIDFNTSPQDIGVSIAKGDIKLSQLKEEQMDSIMQHLVDTDINISGKTFQDVANDADSYFNRALRENPQQAAAYFNAKDDEVILGIVHKQLAGQKLISILKDIQASANSRENLRILSNVRTIENYIETVGSKIGLGLRMQALVKKNKEIFGSEKFSDLALQGINDIADILDTISSNFTRKQPLQEFKAEFVKAFQNHPAYNEIMGNRQLFSKLNDVLEETYNGLKAGKKIDPASVIEETLLKEEADLCGWYAKLADTTKGFTDTIKYWGSKAPSYVINNVLGVASAFKNIASGLVQTNLNCTYKVLGGFLTGNGEITREGIDQWLCTLVNFGESMRLAKQAFVNGDGLLTNTKEFVEGSLQSGFHKWNGVFKGIREDGFGITLQNIHSVIPRFMMASDEFMSQLNYRNIVRAKALAQARREAALDAPRAVDTIFKEQAFTEDGRPLDFNAFVEAKDMLFQVPLNRKIFDPKTGEYRDSGIDSSVISEVGSWVQQGTQRFVPLRIFMPFVKTPANIADQALKSNPLYMVFNENTRKQFFSNNPEIRAKAYGKMATMLTLGAGFTIAAASGNITGSEPIDKKEKTALLKTGWRPYSVKVGDKWIPYMGMIAPLDSYMAFCADMVALGGKMLTPDQEAGLGEMSAQILGSIMNDYIDQAGFRTNTAKLMDIFNPSTDVKIREQLAANTFSGFLPMSGNVNAIRSVVKTVKGETEQTKPEGFYDNLVRNYTDLFTGSQDYKRDVFGNRVDQYGLLIAKATDDKFMQPEYAEMERLAKKGYSPTNITHLLKKTGVPLEEFKSQTTGRSAYDAMYDELTTVKIGGKTLQDSVAALIASPRYQALTDGINEDGKDWSAVPYKTKKKLLDDTFQRYYNMAKRNVINKRGDEFVDANGSTMKQRQQQIRLTMFNEAVGKSLNQNLTNQIKQYGQ